VSRLPVQFCGDFKSKYRGDFKSKYNTVQLKHYLLPRIFDYKGRWLVHNQCLEAQFGICKSYFTSLHKSAATPEHTCCLPKLTIVTEGRERDVIIPTEYQHLTTHKYLNSLGDRDIVTVTKCDRDYHGLHGKPSNNAATRLIRVCPIYHQ
jgi:hypothetical protein